MNRTFPVTGQMIVKNEDRFVWFAVQAVLPYLEKLLVFDTGSTDRTAEIIKGISSPKISLAEKGAVSPAQLTALRREQIARTKTPFFLLVDGDEIWPHRGIEKFLEETVAMPKQKVAAFCRTRNCVGDVFHYLPEEAGRYKLAGRRGHLNIRAWRKVPGLSVAGAYPREEYTFNGGGVNRQAEKLQFIDVWYLHATHLPRSTGAATLLAGRNRQTKYDPGLAMREEDLPEVFFFPRPAGVPDPCRKRSALYLARAVIEAPFKFCKRKFWSRFN